MNLYSLEEFSFFENFNFFFCHEGKKVKKLPKITKKLRHQQLFSNKTSNNHDIWYTGVNSASLEGLFKLGFTTYTRQKVKRSPKMTYTLTAVYTF